MADEDPLQGGLRGQLLPRKSMCMLQSWVQAPHVSVDRRVFRRAEPARPVRCGDVSGEPAAPATAERARLDDSKPRSIRQHTRAINQVRPLAALAAEAPPKYCVRPRPPKKSCGMRLWKIFRRQRPPACVASLIMLLPCPTSARRSHQWSSLMAAPRCLVSLPRASAHHVSQPGLQSRWLQIAPTVHRHAVAQPAAARGQRSMERAARSVAGNSLRYQSESENGEGDSLEEIYTLKII